MRQTPNPRAVRRAVIDAGLGLGLFLALAVGLLGASGLGLTAASQASAAEMARVAAFTGPLATNSAIETAAAKPAILVSQPSTGTDADRTGAMVLLAAVFAALFSFNLAFFRHLRRVYAAPRRGGPRRGI